MQIELSTRFIVQFKEVLDFIAQNSIENALKFESDILEQIKDLDLMPYKYRNSVHFSNPNIRDFVFKGYVVPYLIR